MKGDAEDMPTYLTPQDGATPVYKNHVDQPQERTCDMIPLKQRPDSLATCGHEYEDLPTSSSSNTYEAPRRFYNTENGEERPLPPPFSGPPAAGNSTENLCESAGSELLPPYPSVEHNRRRQNPLYAMRKGYDRVEMPAKAKRGNCLCPYSGLLFVGVSLCALLVLTILILTGFIKTANVGAPGAHIDTNATTLEAALYKINMLESQCRDIEHKLKDMDARAADRTQRVETMQGTLEAKIKRMGRKLDHMIPGFNSSGTGHLSECRYRRFTEGTLGSQAKTVWQPPSIEHAEDWAIMGLECSTEGGILANIKRQYIPRSHTQYQFQCVCSRPTSGKPTVGESTWFCEMDLWECPRIL